MKIYILTIVYNIFLLYSYTLEALSPDIKKEIRCLVKNNLHQLSEAEYELIATTLIDKTPCNMLVFGVGRDSSLWVKLNCQGITVFLEDNQIWFDRISLEIPQINAYLVTYDTKRNQWLELLNRNIEAELFLELPKEIKENKWDIIFVDAPEGWSDEKPGRMKSIFTAAKLAHSSKDCHVFVHDCDRQVEAIYSKKFLHDENLITTQDRLRYYYIP
jgi:uncharacterized protein (TIGR01627 family)